MITEPLPGFTNQRPIGKPVSLRRAPEPTGCLCSRKDTYVHFFLMGKNIHDTNLRREINRTLFFDRHNNDNCTIAVIYAPASCWLHVSRWLQVFRISVCHPCRGIRTGDWLENALLSVERWNAFHCSAMAGHGPFSVSRDTLPWFANPRPIGNTDCFWSSSRFSPIPLI